MHSPMVSRLHKICRGQFVRRLSTNPDRRFRIAIIGSGPAGFYTAARIVHGLPKEPIDIDMFERLPVPFGLARFGVAPDHPEVKNCQEKFEEVLSLRNAESGPKFQLYGNVEVGKDISLQQLKDSYNAVFLAYGCKDENKLGVENEDLPGVKSARQFVGWYNGHFDFQDFDPAIQKHGVEDVTIIGNGNVALDVARMLLTPVDLLRNTDITEEALQLLSESRVRRVNIVARRGVIHSAFTIKELRELLTLEKYGVAFTPVEPEHMNALGPFRASMERAVARKLALLEEYTVPLEQRLHEAKGKKRIQLEKTIEERDYLKLTNSHLVVDRQWALKYHLAPVGFAGHEFDSELLSATAFKSTIIADSSESSSQSSTGNLFEVDNNSKKGDELELRKVHTKGSPKYIKNEIVFKSIGYKGQKLEGSDSIQLPFDHIKHTIPNVGGRIVSPKYYFDPDFKGYIINGATGKAVPGSLRSRKQVEEVDSSLETVEEETTFHTVSAQEEEPIEYYPGWYVSGWIKKGPRGVIVDTLGDAYQTAEVFIRDYEHGFNNVKYPGSAQSEITESKPGFEGIKKELDSRGVKYVTGDDWEKINAVEVAEGRKAGKPRVKLTSREEVLSIL